MGEQSSNLDYHDSGAVPGSVDRNVFFFGGRQFFSVLSLSGKVQCGTLCDVVSGDGFYCMGMEFPKVLRYLG